MAAEAWTNFLKREDSEVVDLCYGQFKSHVTCTGCGAESVTFDPFSCLTLPIPVSKNKLEVSVIFFPLPHGTQPFRVDLEFEQGAGSFNSIKIRDIKRQLREDLGLDSSSSASSSSSHSAALALSLSSTSPHLSACVQYSGANFARKYDDDNSYGKDKIHVYQQLHPVPSREFYSHFDKKESPFLVYDVFLSCKRNSALSVCEPFSHPIQVCVPSTSSVGNLYTLIREMLVSRLFTDQARGQVLAEGEGQGSPKLEPRSRRR